MAQNSALLNLPAELRNPIYVLALPTDQIYRTTTEPRYGFTKHAPSRIPGITAACRQTRNESLPVWRSTNTFNSVFWGKGYCDHGDPAAWLNLLAGSGLQHIRELHIGRQVRVEFKYGISKTYSVRLGLHLYDNVIRIDVAESLVLGTNDEIDVRRQTQCCMVTAVEKTGRDWVAMIEDLTGKTFVVELLLPEYMVRNVAVARLTLPWLCSPRINEG